MSRAEASPENRSFNHTTASVFVLARQASQEQASPFPSDLSNRPIPIDLGPEGPEINTSAGLSGSPSGLGLWELSRMFPGSWTWELGGLSQSELTLLVGLTAPAARFHQAAFGCGNVAAGETRQLSGTGMAS